MTVKECECVDDDAAEIPLPQCPLHGDDLHRDYHVTGKYRTYHNQHGIGTLNDFQLEVRADDIDSARKIAEDKIMSDGRRHADSVRDMEIFPSISPLHKISPSLLTEGMETEADMLEEFGPRCPDHVAGCVVCDGWREWDMRHTDRSAELSPN